MVAASYVDDLTDIFTDGTTTGWSAFGGGQAGLNQETDYFIQGTSCLSKNAWASAEKGMIYNAGATTVTAGDAVFVWLTHATPGSLNTKTAGGLFAIIGSSTSAYYEYYAGGNDTLIYDDRWVCIPIDPRTGTVSPSKTTGSPTSTKSHFGGGADLPTGGPTKGAPFAIDAIRHGKKITVTNGDLSNGYANFDDMSIENDYNDATNGYNRWGLFQKSGGVYKWQGLLELGTSGTAVDFRDSNRVIFIADTEFVVAGFNEIQVQNASSRVDMTNVQISALGTVSRGTWTTTDNADINLDTCTFTDMNTFGFLGNSTVLDCTFRRCNAVTVDGGSIVGSSFLESTVAADAAALIYNNAADPDGEFDNTTFSKGTNAHHAIEFGTSAPTTMTLRNIDFSGFNATAENNDSALNFLRTSGTTTVNLVGCTGDITEKTTGTHSVNFVIDPVTLTVNVTDETGADLNGARVFVVPSDNTGPLPKDQTVTITRSGTTATVAYTAHPFEVNDKVLLLTDSNSDDDTYFGIRTVTATATNSFDYTVDDTGAPANPSGTITATFVMIDADTVSGSASFSTSLASTQPYEGRVRKSSAAPYYKTFPISGDMSSSAATDVNVQMIPDE